MVRSHGTSQDDLSLTLSCGPGAQSRGAKPGSTVAKPVIRSGSGSLGLAYAGLIATTETQLFLSIFITNLEKFDGSCSKRVFMFL